MLEAGIKKYWIELQNVSLCTLFCIEFKETNFLKWIKVGLDAVWICSDTANAIVKYKRYIEVRM